MNGFWPQGYWAETPVPRVRDQVSGLLMVGADADIEVP